MPGPTTIDAVPRPAAIRSFVRRHRSEILAAWRREARTIPVARDLSPVVLVDHIPEMLDQIAEIADEIATGVFDTTTFETARRHALDRLGEGFDVAAVVKELSLLRECMHVIWARESRDMAGLRALDVSIDAAIEASVTRYAEARERSLAGVDRISTATLEAKNVDDLLQRLLDVFEETTPAASTAAILLVDGGLRVRAIVGQDGLLGHVFATPEDLAVELRARGVHAIYGVPLVHRASVIGVAVMGSTHELSQDDRQFFDSLAARATVGIVHQLLRHELGQTLAKLESLLAASPVGIAFVDRELRYLRINEALATINGKSVADHVGRTVHEVLPEYGSRLETLLQHVLETGEPALNLELTRTGATPEETRWLIANYFPVRTQAGTSGVGAIVLDVTDAKRAQHALVAEQRRLQSIIDHAPAAIWVKDSQGHVVLANRRLADALGVSAKEVVGSRSDEFLPEEFAAQHEAHDATVLREQRAIEVEETVPSPEGPRTFLSIKFPIPDDPPLVGGIATEITERKRMEEDLRVAVRSREDMLAVVSHDLRNPLGAVQLSASLLLGSLASDHRARRHLDIIVRSCSRMENLIDDLLDTASIRSGRFHLELARHSVDEVVGEAVDLQQPLASEKGIKLVRELALDGVEIDCDRDRVLQVFGNLIGNALKFCRAGDTITVTGTCDREQLTFAVQDTGPGISATALPHLFEPYWSGPEHATLGSGLGLYIVRGIVESHGGRVWAESAPGSGARFVFTLPLRRAGTTA